MNGGKLLEQMIMLPTAKGKNEADNGYSPEDREKAYQLMKQAQ